MSTRALLPGIAATLGALGGCQWIAGIESTTIGIDAAPPAPDGAIADRPDGGAAPPDGGGDRPDAAVRDDCQAPCVGDAFGEFGDQQGGSNGRWRYVEVRPEQPDQEYVDMTAAILPGPVLGWQGTGTPPPSVALCAGPESEPPCFELQETLALTTPGNAPGAHYPALAWIAPEAGVYVMAGNWRVSSLAPAVEITRMMTRNRYAEVLDEENLLLTTTPHHVSVEVVAVAGDAIVLSVLAGGDESMTVGVELFISGPY